MEAGLTKQRIIAELTRSPHGELGEYAAVATQAARENGEFLAHLIAWNHQKGQVRDAKVALPVCSMMQPGYAFVENSLAHLAQLDPRNFLRSLRFAKAATPHLVGHGRSLRRLVERYLRVREASPNWWMKTVIQHRSSMKGLYALFHIRPSTVYDAMLFKGVRPPGSALEAVANLKDMTGKDAAAAVMQHRLPYLVAVGALGGKSKDEDFVMALIDRMSPAELVTNSKMLEKLGMRDSPVLRASYEQGLQRVAESKTLSLKTSKAVAAVGDEKLKKALTGVQEKQIKAMSIDGDWLVLGDKSQSMQLAIETSALVAATLAKMVKGRVLLVFFDSSPRAIDVTGKTYDEVKAATQYVTAGGATSIGCGAMYALDQGFDPSGIAIVSDGAENTAPGFAPTYQMLCTKANDARIPVYLYWMKCYMPDSGHNNPERLALNMAAAGLEMQTFDLRGGVDFYSLPNVVATMRASRYSLLDEIMETPLLTLDEVFVGKGELEGTLAA